MNNVSHRIVEENLRVAMRCYARVSDKGEARDYPGVVVTSCGMNCAVFNSALLTESADHKAFQRALTLAGVHFGQRSFGWTFWLCEDLVAPGALEATRGLLRNSGMSLIAQPPGMYAERLAPPTRPPAPHLEIRRVDNDAARLDFSHLSSVIFSLPFRTSSDIYGSPQLWTGPMTGWIGYIDGRAVSIATVVIGGGARGVYSVGTLPEYQGRGYAETLMRHALDCALRATGFEPTVLQSTARGLNLYTRMGYKPVTRFGVYLNESCQSF